MDGELDVRLARVEEQIVAIRQQQNEGAAARANLNDELQLLRVAMGGVLANMTHIETSVASINASMRWVVYLIIGAVIVAVLGLVIGAGSGHLAVR